MPQIPKRLGLEIKLLAGVQGAERLGFHHIKGPFRIGVLRPILFSFGRVGDFCCYSSIFSGSGAPMDFEALQCNLMHPAF